MRTRSSGDDLLIEIGILVAGTFDAVDEEALDAALGKTDQSLSDFYGPSGLRFRFAKIRRRELVARIRVEPSSLLRDAQEERDARGWDFVFVVTAADLVGIYSASSCFAVLSRPLDAAVFSTLLIDPASRGESVSDTRRVARLTSRLTRLMLHAVGHLSGLPQSELPDRVMYRPTSASDLDPEATFDESERTRSGKTLLEIADQRLEEQVAPPGNAVVFMIRAAWINRYEIVEAVWAARPWQFPRRLSGLTIASVSTLLILLMTAEAWDLALSQSVVSVAMLGILVAAATTIFVAVRQRLLIRRRKIRSEQNVVTAISAILIVAAGMTITWLYLVASGTLVATLLFSSELIASWAASGDLSVDKIGWGSRLLMSCFCSSLGILIGALGASFESQNYFQHVIFVDEEL